MCAYSRAGQQARSKSLSLPRGSRCLAWPSTTLGRLSCPTPPWGPLCPTASRRLAGGEFTRTGLCLHAALKSLKASSLVTGSLSHTEDSSYCFSSKGVVMATSMTASASRIPVSAVTPLPKATTQGPPTPGPSRARGLRVGRPRAEPGILSGIRTSAASVSSVVR